MSAPSPAQLDAACRDLAGRDAALARAFAETGRPAWRTAAAHYDTLARAVTYQLISLAAAGAIWARVQARLGTPVDADIVLATPEQDLRACGLSGPKIAHLRAIAEACQDRQLDLEALADMPLAKARRCLLAVRGIGPWTADLFALSALGHLDAFPHGDVGLLEAYRLAHDDEVRLSPRDFSATAASWAPYRGVAAHLLWAYLHAHRARNRA